ncbi:MAG: LytR/AlgR family response regulator transcription factor [Candidatus Cryptobacteroides sp.]
MRVLIVEDEPMAQANLCRTLLREYSDIEVVGMTGSVKETLAWLSNPDNRPDVIFMDVELSDGDCFEIFREAEVNAKVVMTTAYDSYAVKAFEVNSIDYLLKPVEKEALDRAVERCRKSVTNTDVSALLTSLNEKPEYRQRFMLRLNDKILPIPVDRIAYFISEDKMTWMYTSDGQKYVMDQSLDVISTELDPSTFFRISRNCIIASTAVRSIIKLQGGRLKINPLPECPSEILVSRSRSDDFLAWMGGR